MLRLSVRLVLIASITLCMAVPRPRDPRIGKGSRLPMNNGWIAVHLEGTPSEIGYQHGALLHHEIAELQKVIELELERDTKKDWAFFRKAAEEILWPKVDQEYREEMQGIVEALNARRIKLDIWDIVALNAFLELGPYYVPYFDKINGENKLKPPVPERCSAFIATGSYTKDGKIVLGHNAWTGYLDGQRWNIVFDVVPAKGNPFIMDGLPGVIHSGDDFAINAAGIAITETTISNFSGFDPNGTPEFVRARKAMQYAESINQFAAIMVEGNNGGYANNWLVGDNKTGEIASLELGLKNVTLRRTTDGYFSGSNYPVNEKLIAEETAFPVHDKSVSANARRIRWDQLLNEHKGKIDVAAGQSFLSDSIDSFTGKDDPNERTLCGRLDLSPRGITGWIPPYGIGGAVQNKVADSTMISAMSFSGAIGPQCGPAFNAREHLAKHPDNRWAAQYLRDFPARPWTTFQAATRP